MILTPNIWNSNACILFTVIVTWYTVHEDHQFGAEHNCLHLNLQSVSTAHSTEHQIQSGLLPGAIAFQTHWTSVWMCERCLVVFLSHSWQAVTHSSMILAHSGDEEYICGYSLHYTRRTKLSCKQNYRGKGAFQTATHTLTQTHSHTEMHYTLFPNILLSAGGQNPIMKPLRLSSVHTLTTYIFALHPKFISPVAQQISWSLSINASE